MMATEKRLISLDEALEATHKEVFWTESEQAAVRSFLVKQPKVDAVEVVRCKDCKHRDEAGCCTPPIISAYGWDHLEPKDNDYCSYGERKDNE
jgi:hypothetical protein